MFAMHPSELKNLALVAASRADRDGFSATAEAWLQIANACALEANALSEQDSGTLAFNMGNPSAVAVAAIFSML